ncbi:hypothetical protein EW146_g8190 [Bondarzewia mesenterica]|uniref:CxC2-like cysteine cluster KDZ transposase-associated domain-containing protein n=1 Tax=Bondarzewia mesenterica TaxID=1095465 RepID=A0A4S4LLW0_9AGAM|nr:hypothetical protein EW146_g8190 [Bondarzewia mesenterica]
MSSRKRRYVELDVQRVAFKERKTSRGVKVKTVLIPKVHSGPSGHATISATPMRLLNFPLDFTIPVDPTSMPRNAKKWGKWTGLYFAPAWLWQVGIVLHLGHGEEPCPQYNSYPSADPMAIPGGDWPEVVYPEEEEWVTLGDHHFSILDDSRESPSSCDKTGNPIMTIIDRSGVHQLCAHRCQCPNSQPIDIQLFNLRLYPSCSGYLASGDTSSSLNGTALDTGLTLVLVLVNSPCSVQPVPSPELTYQITDGNFSAEHMKMRNPWDDVVLTNDTGYMVTDGNYKEHLEEAKELKDADADAEAEAEAEGKAEAKADADADAGPDP